MFFWGPSYWRFIHFFAVNNIGRDLLKKFYVHIPCEKCRDNWEDPDLTEDLVEWSIRMHNKVNKELGKYAGWDRTDFDISHKPTCDICDKKEYYFGFPWTFIHEVARNDAPYAVDFLQAFNAQYPCPTHQGKLLSDPPLEGETPIEWTARNHERLEPGFARYWVKPDGISADCIDCDANKNDETTIEETTTTTEEIAI